METIVTHLRFVLAFESRLFCKSILSSQTKKSRHNKVKVKESRVGFLKVGSCLHCKLKCCDGSRVSNCKPCSITETVQQKYSWSFYLVAKSAQSRLAVVAVIIILCVLVDKYQTHDICFQLAAKAT